MTYSHFQRLGNTVQRARSRRRLEQLRQMSAEGVTRKDAAERIGLTEEGVRTLLAHHLGTTRWPI